jgi:hypothetical protein
LYGNESRFTITESFNVASNTNENEAEFRLGIEAFVPKVNDLKLGSIETVVVSVVVLKQELSKAIIEKSRRNLKDLNFM